MRYKKYFYALRPLLAAEYVEKYHEAPPVLFDELLKLELDPQLHGAINKLLEIKMLTTEKEENPQMLAIQEFIRTEVEKQKDIAEKIKDDHNKDTAALDSIFLAMVKG